MEKAKILKDIIESRRSIYPKSYTQEELSGDIISEILNAASFAPNHKKTKPWRFKVFRGEEKDQLGIQLSEIYKATKNPQAFLEKKYTDIQNKAFRSGAIVTICVNFSGIVPEWEEIAATAMAVQNMYLTATAHEIGCYWSSHEAINDLGDYLNLQDNQKCIGLFYLGTT